MRWKIEAVEPERDPALAAALRAADAASSLSEAEFDRLRQSVRSRTEAHVRANPVALHVPTATLPMERGRRRFPRLAVALPALLAAALAGVLLLRAPRPSPAPPAVTPAPSVASAERALQADVSDAEFARLVTGADDPAALLSIAVATPGTSR